MGTNGRLPERRIAPLGPDGSLERWYSCGECCSCCRLSALQSTLSDDLAQPTPGSSRIIATWISVSLVCTFRSYSLLILLLREIQLNVRSTTQRRGTTLKPRVPDGRSTTSSSQSPVA
jgi:hypothetical protein